MITGDIVVLRPAAQSVPPGVSLPAGPAGPPGQPGAPGAPGQPGAPGANGLITSIAGVSKPDVTLADIGALAAAGDGSGLSVTPNLSAANGTLAKTIGDLTPRRTSVADTAYTVLATDTYVGIANLTAPRTITLPAASSYPAGRVLPIADEAAACSPTNKVTIACSGSDTINGAPSLVLSVPNFYVRLVSDGISKWVAAGRGLALVDDASAAGVMAVGASAKVPLATLFANAVTPYMYGYVDGASPAATQTALQAALNNGLGKPLDLMGRTWTFTGGLTKPAGISIFSATTAQLISTTDSGDIIANPTTGADNNSLLYNFTIWSTVTRTSGYALNLTNFSRALIQKVRVGTYELLSAAGNTSRFYHGVKFSGSFGIVDWYSNQIIGCQQNGLVLGSAVNNGSEFEFVASTIQQCGNIGIYLTGGMGGVKLVSGDVSTCAVGLNVDASIGVANRELFVGRCMSFDTCTGNGAVIGSGALFTLLWDGWSCGHIGHGLVIGASQPAGYRYEVNAYVCDNGGSGLVDNAGGFVATGIYAGNGKQAAGGSGITKAGGGTIAVNHAVLANNGFSSSGAATSGYGFNFTAGSYRIGQSVLATNNTSGNFNPSDAGRVNFDGGLSVSGHISLAASSNIGGPSTSSAFTIGSNPVTAVTGGSFIQFFGSASASFPGQLVFGTGAAVRFAMSTGALYPTTDSAMNVGTSSNRIGTVFAATGTINTSDADYKTGFKPLTDAELDAWADVSALVFQFKDAVEEKGEAAARWHVGYTAQAVRDAFEAKGCDPYRLALFCADTAIRRVPATRKVERETGQMKTVQRVNGDGTPETMSSWVLQEPGPDGRRERVEIETPVFDTVPETEIVDEEYLREEPILNADGSPVMQLGLRYDQCAVIEAAYQRRRADRIEARLAALEARLKAA